MPKSIVERLLAAIQEVQDEELTVEDTAPVKRTRKKRTAVAPKVAEKKQLIVALLQEKGAATPEDITKLLGGSDATAYNYINMLIKEGIITRVGKGLPRTFSLKGNEDARDKWSDAVLDYVSKNEGKRYSVRQMGSDLGMAEGVAYGVVHRLVKRGYLSKDFNLGSELPVEEQAKQAPAQVVETFEDESDEQEGDVLLSQVEFLIWTFVRETRSTDVLAFLTWLEEKSNK